MIYSYGGRVDNDSNAITVIDEENRTAVTTGYINGEYVEFSGGGSSWTLLTEETVTTNEVPEQGIFGIMSYSQLINADTIRVTFNGIEYECEKQVTTTAMGDLYGYGASIEEQVIDWSHYPFSIQSGKGLGDVIRNSLITETAGTYAIKIEVPQP